jgi:hypothetical protein
MRQKAETGRDESVHGSGSAVSKAISQHSVVIHICNHSTSIAAGLSSASSSGRYPNAIYQSAEEVPLTARIEGEVRDSSPNVLFVFAVSSVVSLCTVI